MRTIRSPLIAQDAAASLTSGHLLHLNPPYDQAAWAALPSPSCVMGVAVLMCRLKPWARRQPHCCSSDGELSVPSPQQSLGVLCADDLWAELHMGHVCCMQQLKYAPVSLQESK